MRTIGRHRDDVDALVAPVVSSIRTSLEARVVDDLVTDSGAGHGYRVLGRAVSAPIPLPPFDNSQMDGFAVRAADAGRRVRVVDPVPAGVVPLPLAPGTAAPIMTGARIPEGADAVFPVEATGPGTFPAALSLTEVVVPGDLAVGTFVRATGSDLAAGQELAAAGAFLTPALLGAFVAAGVDRVEVVRRPRLLVVSTGSELIGAAAPGHGAGAVGTAYADPAAMSGSDHLERVSGAAETSRASGPVPGPDHESDAGGAADGSRASRPVPGPDPESDAGGAADGSRASRPVSGHVRAVIGDANGVSLRAALAEVGVETRAIRLPDEPVGFVAALEGAVGEWADIVVTTGGISMGAYEVVREALVPLGLTVTPVAMQPGGPQALGAVRLAGREVPVIAFPGNPVSALVSFEVFLRPVLAAVCGVPRREVSELPADGEATSPEGKHQVRRGTVVDGRVSFVGGPSSHLIAHYAEATHLVHVPVGVGIVRSGDPLTVWRIR